MTLLSHNDFANRTLDALDDDIAAILGRDGRLTRQQPRRVSHVAAQVTALLLGTAAVSLAVIGIDWQWRGPPPTYSKIASGRHITPGSDDHEAGLAPTRADQERTLQRLFDRGLPTRAAAGAWSGLRRSVDQQTRMSSTVGIERTAASTPRRAPPDHQSISQTDASPNNAAVAPSKQPTFAATSSDQPKSERNRQKSALAGGTSLSEPSASRPQQLTTTVADASQSASSKQAGIGGSSASLTENFTVKARSDRSRRLQGVDAIRALRRN